MKNWRPPSLNAFIGRHWSVLSRAKRAAAELIRAHALQQRVPDARGKRRVSARITLKGRQKPFDGDNVQKCLLDCLKTARLIVDDSDQWLEWGGVEWSRGRATVTVLVFEDLSP